MSLSQWLAYSLDDRVSPTSSSSTNACSLERPGYMLETLHSLGTQWANSLHPTCTMNSVSLSLLLSLVSYLAAVSAVLKQTSYLPSVKISSCRDAHGSQLALPPSPPPPASDELDSVLYTTTDSTTVTTCVTVLPLSPHLSFSLSHTLHLHAAHNLTPTSVNTNAHTHTAELAAYNYKYTRSPLLFLWACLIQSLHVHVCHVWKVQPMQCLYMAHTHVHMSTSITHAVKLITWSTPEWASSLSPSFICQLYAPKTNKETNTQ